MLTSVHNPCVYFSTFNFIFSFLFVQNTEHAEALSKFWQASGRSLTIGFIFNRWTARTTLVTTWRHSFLAVVPAVIVTEVCGSAGAGTRRLVGKPAGSHLFRGRTLRTWLLAVTMSQSVQTCRVRASLEGGHLWMQTCCASRQFCKAMEMQLGAIRQSCTVWLAPQSQ